MSQPLSNLLLALFAICALGATGCMQPHLRSDACGAILDHNLFTLALDSVLVPYDDSRHPEECGAFGCVDDAPSTGEVGACELGCPVVDASEEIVYCDDDGNCGLQVVQAKPAREPTPPLVKYVPPMPPKFLAVPTQPAFTEVSTDAPLPLRGGVERNFGRQLTFPGRD